MRTLVAIVRRINNLLRPLPQVSPQGAQTVPHVFEGGVSATEIPGHGFESPTMLEPPHLQVGGGVWTAYSRDLGPRVHPGQLLYCDCDTVHAV